MNQSQIESKIRRHWTQWLPARVRGLKDERLWEPTVRALAIEAMQMYESLLKAGRKDFEAEEVVMRTMVLLPPEPGAESLDWEKEELAAMEAEYQRDIAPNL